MKPKSSTSRVPEFVKAIGAALFMIVFMYVSFGLVLRIFMPLFLKGVL